MWLFKWSKDNTVLCNFMSIEYTESQVYKKNTLGRSYAYKEKEIIATINNTLTKVWSKEN